MLFKVLFIDKIGNVCEHIVPCANEFSAKIITEAIFEKIKVFAIDKI